MDVEYEDLSVEKAVPLHRLAPRGQATAESTDAQDLAQDGRQTFQEGQQVIVEYDDEFYVAQVYNINADGTLDVVYEDFSEEVAISLDRVQPHE